jgi:hypothetical protein
MRDTPTAATLPPPPSGRWPTHCAARSPETPVRCAPAARALTAASRVARKPRSASRRRGGRAACDRGARVPTPLACRDVAGSDTRHRMPLPAGVFAATAAPAVGLPKECAPLKPPGEGERQPALADVPRPSLHVRVRQRQPAISPSLLARQPCSHVARTTHRPAATSGLLPFAAIAQLPPAPGDAQRTLNAQTTRVRTAPRVPRASRQRR